MRIRIQINTPGGVLIPFDHQPALTGVIHKWLGQNEFHGTMSLFSFSRLEGGKAVPQANGLWFEHQASLIVSAYEADLMQRLIAGIQKEPQLFRTQQGDTEGKKVEPFKNFVVTDVEIDFDREDLSEQERFLVASPILVKKMIAPSQMRHLRYDDPEAGSILTETLKHKMEMVGLSDPSLQVVFDTANGKTQLINYKGVRNRVNWCPVIIHGTHETKAFARNTGMGHSTGIGFGCLR